MAQVLQVKEDLENMKNKNPLRSINVRKGLELNVNLEDIFKVDMKPSGNILALKIHTKKIKNKSQLSNKELKALYDKEEFIMYSSKAEKHTVNENLIAFVRDVYFAYLESVEEDGYKYIKSEKDTEIEFVNTEKLDFFNFGKNIMDAQRFSGMYDIGTFNYRFLGVGTFNISEYIENHNIIVHSSLEFSNFFIFRKNILSTIDKFILGGYKKDIEEQKEYFNKKEFDSLLKIAQEQKELMENEFKNLFNNIRN